MNKLSMTIFAKIALFAIAFYAIFLYTNRQATWASNGNLCLHNRKLPTFVQVVFLVFVTAYFLDYYLINNTVMMTQNRTVIIILPIPKNKSFIIRRGDLSITNNSCDL
ncbi:hypothetical protein LP117_07770 [Moraxella bovis]|uniref:hypothetical protein n=2 Tax=Moraxella bovis TaxID=476 RepID=UPI002227BC12|nr:hypothetical protein [Moraxella bovis]UZA23687.1 hypothetical protein LP117_07770 [Moraxella bovis]UZA30807.1 hypothetical protein LP097_03990 [Moraxella bovis]